MCDLLLVGLRVYSFLFSFLDFVFREGFTVVRVCKVSESDFYYV